MEVSVTECAIVGNFGVGSNSFRFMGGTEEFGGGNGTCEGTYSFILNIRHYRIYDIGCMFINFMTKSDNRT